MSRVQVFASEITRRMTTTEGRNLDPILITVLVDQVLPIFLSWLQNICNVQPVNANDHVRSLNARRPKFLRSQMDKALVEDQIERHKAWCEEYRVPFRRREAVMSKDRRAEIVESTIQQVLATSPEDTYQIILELE